MHSLPTRPHPANYAPIGVFDSGLGGLSVVLEIQKELPHEDILYLADSAYVPYGGRSPEFILERSRIITQFLLAKGAKALVIACNTATALAVSFLREEYPTVPIIGMEPAVKPAVAATKVGVVGVLATVGTLASAKYAGLLGKFDNGRVKVVSQAAPGLVECVEAGELDTPATRGKVASFVQPLLEKEVDVIVLGCTHYPFLRSIIQEVAGPNVKLIDTGAAVAKQVHKKLHDAGLESAETQPSKFTFYTTGDPDAATVALKNLLPWPTEVQSVTVE